MEKNKSYIVYLYDLNMNRPFSWNVFYLIMAGKASMFNSICRFEYLRLCFSHAEASKCHLQKMSLGI